MWLRWFNIITLTLGGKCLQRRCFVTLMCITIFMFRASYSLFLLFEPGFLLDIYCLGCFFVVTSPTPHYLQNNKEHACCSIQVFTWSYLTWKHLAVMFPAGRMWGDVFILCFCPASLTYVLSVYDRKSCISLKLFSLFFLWINFKSNFKCLVLSVTPSWFPKLIFGNACWPTKTLHTNSLFCFNRFSFLCFFTCFT